jgi:hypothetical protein
MSEFENQQAPGSRHPNFTGDWKFVKQEGLPKFMKAMDISWAFRKAAWAFNYGIGKVRHEIFHDGGDVFKVTVHGPKGSKTIEITIDGTKFVTETERGEVEASSVWSEDGSTICTTLTSVEVEGTRSIQEEDGLMCITQTKKGVTAKRWFEKKV